MQAVILAGGRGTRLAPYSFVLPKPLMPMGEMPILAVVIKQLRHYGVDQVIISLGYLGELIQAYFHGNGDLGVEIVYVTERQPLGTAGALKCIPRKLLEPNFLVLNGDVLTDLDFRSFFESHLEAGVVASISTYARQVRIDYGILEVDEQRCMTSYTEKPTLSYKISMGVYAFQRSILDRLKESEYLDVPDLMQQLLIDKERVLTVPFDGEWIDIGNPVEYSRASQAYASKPEAFLHGNSRE